MPGSEQELGRLGAIAPGPGREDARGTAKPTDGPSSLVALAVDASASGLDLLCSLLLRIPSWRIDVRRAQDVATALAIVRETPVDVVLSDLRLGAVDGIQLLGAAREQGYRGAYVVLSGEGDERVVARAMRAGASDYLPKEDLSVPNLHRSLRNSVERSRLEQEVHDQRRRLVEANRALELRNLEIQRFSHVLSHELRSPLTAARLFLSVLAERNAGPLSPTQLEYLGHVKESCDRMRESLDSVLEITRLETGRSSLRLERRDLGELTRRTVASFEARSRASGVDLSWRAAPALPEAWIDPPRIARVIAILVGNAIEATAERGSVAVEVDVDPADPARLRVGVAESGDGIPAEQRANLFHRPDQVRDGGEPDGTGLELGLFICREIVRLHGGEISVESGTGRGTTFAFTCPTVALETLSAPAEES